KSFEMLDSYWSDIASKGAAQLRGQLDNYLPIELSALGHRAAQDLMRSFAHAFFGARNPKTGLIPYSYDANEPYLLTRMGGKQPVWLIARAAEFLSWFPDDAQLRSQTREL